MEKDFYKRGNGGRDVRLQNSDSKEEEEAPVTVKGK